MPAPMETNSDRLSWQLACLDAHTAIESPAPTVLLKHEAVGADGALVCGKTVNRRGLDDDDDGSPAADGRMARLSNGAGEGDTVAARRMACGRAGKRRHA